MRGIHWAILTWVGVATPTAGLTQSVSHGWVDTLDLSRKATGESPVQIEPGVPIRIYLHNRLPSPNARYTVSTLVSNEPTPPIDASSVRFTTSGMLSITPCAALDAQREKLITTKTESEVPATANALKIAIDNALSCDATAVARAVHDLRQTVDSIDVPAIARGQRVEVNVVRAGPAEGATNSWRLVFTTGARGSWRTLYGFGISPDLDDGYFVESTGSAKTIVRDRREKSDVALTPAIFFSYMRSDDEAHTWSHGWVGGLGANNSKLALLIGHQLTYNQNASLAIGALVNQQRRLLGKYKVGQTIESDLTSDQLTSERYLPNAFIGLSFRFKDNPFSDGKGSGDAGSGGTGGGSGMPAQGAKKAADR